MEICLLMEQGTLMDKQQLSILAFHPSPFYLLKLRLMLRLADLVETVILGQKLEWRPCRTYHFQQ